MHEVRVEIVTGVTLIAHPGRQSAGVSMGQAGALLMLRPAKGKPAVMARLRHVLTHHQQLSHLTDEQVLALLAGEVSHHTMLLQIKAASKPATGKVKFADLWKNYPTNALYATDPKTRPNIWTYIGNKVEYNGTTVDPKSKDGGMIFANSCAVRMSRTLNYSGALLKHDGHKTVSGSDGKWYYFRITDLALAIAVLFGKGTMLNLKTWRKDIAGKMGIVKFSAKFLDATGHLALWNGKQLANLPLDDQDAVRSEVDGATFWEVP